MRDKTSPTPLANLSDTELQVLTRLIGRFARAVAQYSALASAVHRASAARDAAVFFAVKEQMGVALKECLDCQTALRVLQEELSQAESSPDSENGRSRYFRSKPRSGQIAFLCDELYLPDECYVQPDVGAPISDSVEVWGTGFPEEVSPQS